MDSRVKAMKWWEELSFNKKLQLTTDFSYFDRHPDSLTGREIEILYNNNK